MKEYSLSFGILSSIAAIVTIQDRFLMILFLAAGVAFLSLSMVAAATEPPAFSNP